jgi:hypothetical protein
MLLGRVLEFLWLISVLQVYVRVPDDPLSCHEADFVAELSAGGDLCESLFVSGSHSLARGRVSIVTPHWFDG